MNNKFALIAMVILVVPLALYFVPYSYASTVNTPYANKFTTTATAGPSTFETGVACNPGDYATGGGIYTSGELEVTGSFPSFPSGFPNPTAWAASGNNPNTFSVSYTVYVDCLAPITVAGIGVPEFGQLYIAIALGALVFFLMGRYMTKKNALTSVPSTPIQ